MMSEYELALADHVKAIRIDHEETWFYHGRAITYRIFDKHRLALAEYMTLTKEDQYDPEWLVLQGVVLTEMGEFEQALDSYAEARKISPYFVLTELAAADTLRSMRDYDQAIELLLSALEIQPNYDTLLYEIATTYRNAGR